MLHVLPARRPAPIIPRFVSPPLRICINLLEFSKVSLRVLCGLALRLGLERGHVGGHLRTDLGLEGVLGVGVLEEGDERVEEVPEWCSPWAEGGENAYVCV